MDKCIICNVRKFRNIVQQENPTRKSVITEGRGIKLCQKLKLIMEI